MQPFELVTAIPTERTSKTIGTNMTNDVVLFCSIMLLKQITVWSVAEITNNDNVHVGYVYDVVVWIVVESYSDTYFLVVEKLFFCVLFLCLAAATRSHRKYCMSRLNSSATNLLLLKGQQH